MLRRMYDAVFKLSGSRHAPATLFAVSFSESSFFPIPPDVMLAPMCLTRPEKAYWYATLCTIASVLGGLLGYAIGYFLEPVGIWILSLLGKAETFEATKTLFQQHGAWVILIKGLTPIPFKLITIASGIFVFNLPLFIALCVLTRGARFFLVAYVVKTFGPAMLPVIEKRLALFAGLLIAAVAALLIWRHFA
jgi:membrane protein YqaA with SNARE-associated domain